MSDFYSYGSQELDGIEALLEMHRPDQPMLKGAAGEVAFIVRDALKLVRQLKRQCGPKTPFLCFAEALSARCPGAQCAKCSAEERRRAAEPEVRLNDDKTLDEVVATSANVQLEQMDYNHWFLEIGGVAVWLHAKGKITATYELRHDATPMPSKEKTDGI